MDKRCGTCLYWKEEDYMTDGSRRCSWFAATQLGRKLKEVGPFWSDRCRSLPTYKNNGTECPAYELSHSWRNPWKNGRGEPIRGPLNLKGVSGRLAHLSFPTRSPAPRNKKAPRGFLRRGQSSGCGGRWDRSPGSVSGRRINRRGAAHSPAPG